MSTIISDGKRSIQELKALTSYSEMSDEEIERLIKYEIDMALMSKETMLKNQAVIMELEENIVQNANNCEQSREALQYMCGQIMKPQGLTITAIEFRPMEFGNE